MLRRVTLIAGTVLAALVAVVAAPAAAWAYIGQRGDPHPLGTVNTLLIFIGGPVGVFIIIALLCLRPQRAAGAARYRPGRNWPYAPQWFGTAPPLDGEAPAAERSPGHGGASGSW